MADVDVFITHTEAKCAECGGDLERGAWIVPVEQNKVLCLTCADLDHLEFLPSGNPALTRRAHKASTLTALVLEWNRRHKRYERRGILVEDAALRQAEQECLADEEVRARRRERDAERREVLDAHYIEQFARRVRELYPGCPPEKETLIAEHACQKYSGRVGRSASAKELDAAAVRLAVVAHIRHTETDYDRLLSSGVARQEARRQITDRIAQILEKWQKKTS